MRASMFISQTIEAKTICETPRFPIGVFLDTEQAV